MKTTMKKILSLLMCLVLLASVMTMVACDEDDDKDNGPEELAELAGKTPEEAYELAYQYMAGLTNYTMTSKQKVTVSVQGFSQTQNQTLVNKQNGTDYYMKSSGIEGAEMEMVWIDDVAYYDMMGMKFKLHMTLEEAAAATGMELNDAGLVELPQGYFQNAKFKKTADGYELAFEIEKSLAEELFVDQIAGAYGVSASLADDLNYSVVFDQNANPVAMNVNMTINMTIDGVGATVKADSKSTFSDIGTTTIDPPANPYAYEEYDLDDLQ